MKMAITFGVQYGQVEHPVLPGVTGKHYLVIEADGWMEAREEAQRITGGHFAFPYLYDEDFLAIAKKHGWVEYALPEQEVREPWVSAYDRIRDALDDLDVLEFIANAMTSLGGQREWSMDEQFALTQGLNERLEDLVPVPEALTKLVEGTDLEGEEYLLYCQAGDAEVSWVCAEGDVNCAHCEEDVRGEKIRHVGHYSRLGGTWWCDTCDSPYCNLA